MLSPSSQLDLGEASGTLDPVEHLFNAFAAAVTDGIAEMTGGPLVDGHRARLAGLREMPIDRDVRCLNSTL